ncbi:MAG: hypothetical protein M9962_14665 [Oligoflexia bacterium]|nr:hypothetical protein [Oligoflexia bacterium]
MRKTLLMFGLFISLNAFADEIPNNPPNPCIGGCTEKMQEIYNGFLNNPTPPEITPSVFSGNCYFKSRDYNPHHAHRSLIYLDQHPVEDRFFFASGFHFFGPPDTYADYTISKLRKRVKEGQWKNFGQIEIAENTARSVIYNNEGKIAWLYFMRQDPLTRTIYYITYWGGASQISFCEMNLNPSH